MVSLQTFIFVLIMCYSDNFAIREKTKQKNTRTDRLLFFFKTPSQILTLFYLF